MQRGVACAGQILDQVLEGVVPDGATVDSSNILVVDLIGNRFLELHFMANYSVDIVRYKSLSQKNSKH